MDEIFEYEGYMIFEAAYEKERFFIAAETALDALGKFVDEAESFYDYMDDEMIVSIKPLAVDRVEALFVEIYHDDDEDKAPLKQEFLRKWQKDYDGDPPAAFVVGYLVKQGRAANEAD